MKIEKEYFIIECDKELPYLNELVEYLETRTLEIMNQFHLTKLKNKKKIVIYNDKKLYQKHIEEFFPYQEYMCADTNDGNINLLSIEEARKLEEHKDMNLSEMKQNICHEFVHICQQELEIESMGEDITWFWEAMATNIGNPSDFEVTELNDLSNIDNFNTMKNNYQIAFTIGKYMLEEINMDEIIEYMKYPKKLKMDEKQILLSALEWSLKKNIK